MISVAAQISVRVNDEPRTFAASTTLLKALRELGLSERRGLAIAIDDRVIPRAQWQAHELAEGERILVIQATQGG